MKITILKAPTIILLLYSYDDKHDNDDDYALMMVMLNITKLGARDDNKNYALVKCVKC